MFACGLWMRGDPIDHAAAKIAQRVAGGGIVGEIAFREIAKVVATNELDERGVIGVEGFEEAEPVLTVVNLEALEGAELVVGRDEGVDLGELAAIFADDL